MAKKPSTEVAEVDTKSTELDSYDYASMAGEGAGDTNAGDISVPFINLLQPLSPQVSGDSAIDGAKPGDFYNNVTQEIIPGKVGFVFQPCFRDHHYVEWIPKDAGGGFVGRHELGSDAVLAAIENNGGSKYGALKIGANDLTETVNFSGLILDPTGTEVVSFAVLSFWSSKLKPLRNIWTQHTIKRVPFGDKKVAPPLYAWRWLVQSKGDKNKKGQPFFNYNIDLQKFENMFPPNGNAVYGGLLKEGQMFMNQVKSGVLRADVSTLQASHEPGADVDADTPF